MKLFVVRIFFSGFLFISVLSAQPEKHIDSLKNILKLQQTDLGRAKILHLLSKAYININLEKSKKHALEGIRISRKYGLTNDLGNLYNLSGIIESSLGKKSFAMKYFDSATICYTQNNNIENLILPYVNIGIIYFDMGNYQKAMGYYLKSLKLAESINSKINIAVAYSNISVLNSEIGNHQTALKNGRIVYKIYSDINDIDGQAYSCFSLADIFHDLNNFDSTLKYIQTSIKLYKTIQNNEGIADNYMLLGDLYKKKKDYNLTLTYTFKAYDLYNNIGINSGKTTALFLIAETYYDKKEYEKSILYCNQILEFPNSMIEAQIERGALELLMKNYNKMGNSNKAMVYALKFFSLKDSILNETNLKQIADLNTNYEIEKKEQENKFLKQKNLIQELEISKKQYFIYTVIGISILILIASYFFIKYYRSESQRKNNDLKQKLLRSQMNPHFIFNCLIAIQSFIYESNPKVAGKYLSSFAKLIRSILENSNEEYISLSKEIKLLENYFDLQLLRFESKFEYRIKLDENIDSDNILIPPMLTQPFIENTLEHGFNDSNGSSSKLEVNFSVLNSTLTIEVKDNGIGFNPLKENKKKSDHKSLATKITTERLYLLNRKNSKKIHFSIHSKESEGTLVTFSIPLEKLNS